MKTLSCHIKKYIYAQSKSEVIRMYIVDMKEDRF